MSTKIIVGITQGDSNGVGYEVIIKALSSQGILDICTPVVYGSSKIFGFYKKNLLENEPLTTNLVVKASDAHHKRVNFINCVPESFLADPGNITAEGAQAALISLEAAVADLKEGNIDVLVTAPFNKSAVSKEGFSFPGHTEYLAKEFGVEDSLMMMTSEDLKVGLVTNHLPMSQVPEAITKEMLSRKISLLSESLKRDFAVDRPKIAVLSLNPHCGDNGLLGNEEQEIIKPVIEEKFAAGELVFGPFPSDGFFAAPYSKGFDGVLAMYHDQGLIPFKLTDRERGVNYTAGLPVVRCSPDHGTAFDIAGKGKAGHLSMLAAIYTACDVFSNRKNYDQLRANPLKVEVPGTVRDFD
ncbi:MAG: 4-hydroxythreonine-4-phosphate dehydrogenase PdxA [Bacteroidia bacterium]|jgi:4-hydroxythreonine-4-phosphate dehydrogenase|nr:4-hydroxythreonine-4-phosphate dehydrogenase PdxA [Bacteroidales bacterium]MDD3299263.1 4-hydroxythreonine-4-phosphate dehydrogenase PdxA [Bacteroidales bacterium]MDD3843154.1 4-hydroxythreonine-4-phosphate dehydrogenase PdxA [Bacteroidales bacterium]MDD4617962.1 4-hydroxythreonine-4-phosphate dehydrogenase PdxA [Bacteroidales bacterium]NCC46282.1 4-hydroxythreonine-4-phosphate dehydrogenase PdxA [Bacteroidia bacterium]